MANTYTYRDAINPAGTDIAGFDVEATDGSIGSVDEHSADAGSSYLVVDTGFWIFGKKRLIPAGAVERIDLDDEKIYVSMTKDQIKDAPDYDETLRESDPEWYRSGYEPYYDPYASW